MGWVAHGIAISSVASALCFAPRAALAQTVPSEGSSKGAFQDRDDFRARALYESGQEHYDVQNYEAAARDFREALRISGRPELLYNLAQAERLSGDCTAALEHYRAFRAAGLEAPADLEEKISDMERCANAVPPTPPLASQPVQSTVAPPVVVHRDGPPSPAPVDRKSTRRILGWASLAGAAVSATLGTMLAVRANAASNELEAADQPGTQWGPRYQSYEDAMVRDRNRAIGFFIGAGVLAGTGAWLVLSAPTDSRGSSAAVRTGWSF